MAKAEEPSQTCHAVSGQEFLIGIALFLILDNEHCLFERSALACIESAKDCVPFNYSSDNQPPDHFKTLLVHRVGIPYLLHLAEKPGAGEPPEPFH